MLGLPAIVGGVDVAHDQPSRRRDFRMRAAQQPKSRRERRAQARLQERPPRPRTTRRAGRPIWQSPVVAMTVAAIAIGIGIIALANRPATPTAAGELTAPPTFYTADLAKGNTLGSATAPVVMELYADFQCPACKLFVTTELSRLWTDFIQPGTLRIEARDIAFLGTGNPNESVELAAGAACAAEQDRYWRFHDYVFWNQGRENKGDHSAAFISQLADAAGVERTAWEACLARDDVRATIQKNTTTAHGRGVNSTPTLVLNGGAPMSGVPDYDTLAARIRELAGASPAPSAPTPS
jgi:protein-disulfide isomerase